MNNKESGIYIIVDAGTRVILGGPTPFEVASRVARSVLDVLVIGIGNGHWIEFKRDLASSGESPHLFNYAYRRGQITSHKPSDYEKERSVKVGMVTDAFRHLLWLANHTVEGVWSTTTLDMSDLPLAVNTIDPFVEAYTKATGIDTETARAQVEFDRDSLLVLVARRKEVLYKFHEAAANVSNLEELNSFKASVHFDVISAGAV